MKKFMVIYHAPEEAMAESANKTKEEMAEGMKPWMAWAEQCGEGLVDMGQPLGSGQKVTQDGVEPSDKEVVGYSILQAEDMDGAVAMLKDHPHLQWKDSCKIEVHEMFPIPGS